MAEFFDDVLADLESRAGRFIILAGAILLGIAGLISALAIGDSARSQISAELARTALDRVQLSTPDGADARLGEESVSGASALNGVRSAALSVSVPGDDAIVRRFPGADPEPDVAVRGVTPEWLSGEGITTRPMSVPGTWSSWSESDVVIVGADVADRLSLPAAGPGYTVLIGAERFEVIAIADGGDEPTLRQSILLPFERAVQIAGDSARPEITVRTVLGASTPVAEALPRLLSPEDPSQIRASGAEDFGELRSGVTTTLDVLMAGVGSALWLLAFLMVTTSMTVSVLNRSAEIGLRRALGYSRTAVAAKFLAEGAVIGVVGGFAGAGTGAIVTIVACRVLDWSPHLDPALLLAGGMGGGLTGMVASLYPAVHAARIDPATAVRST